MEFKELVDKLAQLGFSSYEARAYITLLKHHPVTGYELAKSSGIPPSKIYEVIAKLLSRSIISPLSGKPTKYIPQDNRVFLKNLQTNFHETISYLENHLPHLGDIDVDYVWNVNNTDEIMSMAKDMVRSAKESVILLGWDSELTEILKELKKTEKKKKIAIIQFGHLAAAGNLL
jgi:sugar-specific transcriptional regulator TrmB